MQHAGVTHEGLGDGVGLRGIGQFLVEHAGEGEKVVALVPPRDPHRADASRVLELAGVGDWSRSSRTEDDRLCVMGAGSDTRPGVAYFYDWEARSLRVLYETRPELAGAALAPMRPVPSWRGTGCRWSPT